MSTSKVQYGKRRTKWGYACRKDVLKPGAHELLTRNGRIDGNNFALIVLTRVVLKS